MTALQRHTLCWLEPSTLDEIAAQLEDEFGHLPAVLRQQAREYLLSGSLPGIVRRGLRSENSVPLGFSFPLRWQGQRVRLATEAALSAITRYSTPEQTASLSIAERTNAIGAFHALRRMALARAPARGLGFGRAGNSHAVAMERCPLGSGYSRYPHRARRTQRMLGLFTSYRRAISVTY